MYRFGKKFKRSNNFCYSTNKRKFPTKESNTNIPCGSQSYKQENVACNVDLNDDNEQKEECVSQDLFNLQRQDFEDSFADVHQHGDAVATEQSNQDFQFKQNNISPVYHYASLLKQFGYVTNLFEQKSFALLDYNVDKRSIMHTSYIFVHRFPHQLSERYVWVLCCSCDQSRMQFVKTLNDRIESDLDKAIPYPSCLHVSAMEKFLDVYDKNFDIDAKDFFMESKTIPIVKQEVSIEHSYNKMQPEEDLFCAVCGGMQWIAVKPVKYQWGVCTFVYSKISPEMRDYFEMATRSEEKVQLFLTGNENDANDFCALPEKNGSTFFVPPNSGCCPCGAEWDGRLVQDDWLDVEDCSVAYLYSIHQVNVYYRPCLSCDNKKHYDGIENRVVWFGSFCIPHAVLKDYIRLFITSSLPMYKYYVAFVQRQVSSGNFAFRNEIIYTKFRLSVIAIIRLLDIEFDNGFFCEICRNSSFESRYGWNNSGDSKDLFAEPFGTV